MVVEVFVKCGELWEVLLAPSDRWNDVDFTVFAYRSKKNILMDFAVNSDSETVRFN